VTEKEKTLDLKSSKFVKAVCFEQISFTSTFLLFWFKTSSHKAEAVILQMNS